MASRGQLATGLRDRPSILDQTKFIPADGRVSPAARNVPATGRPWRDSLKSVLLLSSLYVPQLVSPLLSLNSHFEAILRAQPPPDCPRVDEKLCILVPLEHRWGERWCSSGTPLTQSTIPECRGASLSSWIQHNRTVSTSRTHKPLDVSSSLALFSTSVWCLWKAAGKILTPEGGVTNDRQLPC